MAPRRHSERAKRKKEEKHRSKSRAKRKKKTKHLSLKSLLRKLRSPPPRIKDDKEYRVCPVEIRVDADCAGLMTESMALDNLGVKHQVDCFAESNKALRKLLQRRHPQASCISDLTERDDDDSVGPAPDLYVFGAPCQPWSPAGKKKGNKDKLKRNLVLWKCISHIRSKRPRTIIMENSHSLGYRKFREVRRQIVSFIKSYG